MRLFTGRSSRAWVRMLVGLLVLVGGWCALAGQASAAGSFSVPAPNATDWQLNGTDAAFTGGGDLLLTTPSGGEADSAFYTTPIDTSVVTVSFDLKMSMAGVLGPAVTGAAGGLVPTALPVLLTTVAPV